MTNDPDPSPELVKRLVSLDDRLRRGEVSSDSIDSELASLGDPDSDEADLWGCLKALEDHWPRGVKNSPRLSAPGGTLALHPALSLALSSGDVSPRFGKFIIKSELGRGGFGVVFLAEDTVLRRDVALKLPRPELLLDATIKRRFLQEAKSAAGIDHPHVAPVFEAGEIGSLCYLAAAYCPGGTLTNWLMQLGGPAPPRQAARVIETLATALAHIHEQGILHRDLKPGNVLLWPASEPTGPDELPFIPKLTDFGLSKILAESLAESRSSVLLGTPLYMAPEQAEGRLAAVGPATDIFALGAILYELLTGQLAFPGSSLAEVFDKVRHLEPRGPRELNPAVPRELEVICLRCLEKQPEHRYATGRQLAEDMQRFLQGLPIHARPLGSLQRAWRWCQQPQRIREAGLTVIAINLATEGWTLLTATMIAWGIVPPGNMTAADAFRLALPTIVCVGPAMIVAGAAMTQKKRWAVLFALGTGIGMTLFAIFLSLSWVSNPFAALWNDTPAVSMIIYSMLTMLCLLQTVVSAIAWIAIRAERAASP